VSELYSPVDYGKLAVREVKQVLSSASIPANGTSEFVVESFSRHSSVAVTVRAAYNASATAGVRIRWLYSADNINFDTPEDAEADGNYSDLTFTAGATRQKTVLIPLFQPYVKIQIVNKDTSYPVTVSCWITRIGR
jgi:hypothetical protein